MLSAKVANQKRGMSKPITLITLVSGMTLEWGFEPTNSSNEANTLP